jgi:hypothetical protein
MAIWYNLCWFGTFCVGLVHFSSFGITYQEKSGNPGSNPTIVSYNASAAKNYNPTNSSFLKQKIFSSVLTERSIPLQRRRCGCKFKSRRIGSWLCPCRPNVSSKNCIFKNYYHPIQMQDSITRTICNPASGNTTTN